MRNFNIKRETETTVTDQDIADWVITAFEGGITYWCEDVRPMQRDAHGDWQELTGEGYTQFQIEGVGGYANPEFWDNDSRGYQLYDMHEEKWVTKVLTLSSLLKALNWQPPKNKHASPNWFRKVVDSMVTENYDAGDADCLVQVAVLGDLVYG